MGTHLNVRLVPVGPGRRLFYAGAEAEADSTDEPVGRFEGWTRRLKARWQTSQGSAARGARHAWEWLHRRAHPDEPLLSRLRTARSVTLTHPVAMDAQEAASAWSAFLVQGRNRHLPWFVVNLLVSPLTVVLALLPGPNIVGYWFVYRAVHHFLILLGVRRVRRQKIETLFRPAEGSDPSGADDPDTIAARLGEAGEDPAHVREFLKRQGLPPREAADRTNPIPTQT